jgi:hypothetical protein
MLRDYETPRGIRARSWWRLARRPPALAMPADRPENDGLVVVAVATFNFLGASPDV